MASLTQPLTRPLTTPLMTALSAAARIAGGGVSPDYFAIMAWHQSNMAGAHRAATGGTLSSPADDAITEIIQYSPNGGTGAGDPAKAKVIQPATGHLLFPSGVSPDIDVAVSPAFSYAKALVAAGLLSGSQKIVIFPFGKGGTSMREYMDYALTAGQPQNPGTTQPLFEDAKATWAQWQVEHPNTVVHSMVYSPTENEMLEGITPAETAQRFALLFQSHRNLPGCANAPIGLLTPTPEFTVTDPYKLIYNEIARAAVLYPKTFMYRTPPGISVGGDQVHVTNTGQRGTRGPNLKVALDAYPSMQSAAPPQVTVHSLNAQTLSFTSVGAPLYIIQISPPGAGTWTDYELNILQDDRAGQTITMTLPGSGSRDYRIVAKSYGGQSISSVGNYTASGASIPARAVELDFHNAPVDGSQNITSVPSIGSDTTAWTPTSSAGTGALAAMQKVAQGSKNILQISTANKCLSKAGLLIPAGDYTIAIPLFLANGGNGALVAWGQASTLGDIFLALANSSTNIRIGHTNSNSQVITSGGPLTGQTNKWHMITVTYDRTANEAKIYLNSALLVTGTPTQRASSPANSGGTKLFGNNVDSQSNGLTSAKIPTVEVWSQVLTAAEVSAHQTQRATDYGITFG